MSAYNHNYHYQCYSYLQYIKQQFICLQLNNSIANSYNEQHIIFFH